MTPLLSSGKAKRVHWALKDPARAQGDENEIIKVFRRVRDKIKSYIENEKRLDPLKK